MGDSPVERCCFQFTTRAGTESEYERRHDELRPELQRAITEAGFTNYTLFRSGTTITAYCECTPSAAAALAALGRTEVNSRWNEYLSGVILDLHRPDGSVELATEVWHLP